MKDNQVSESSIILLQLKKLMRLHNLSPSELARRTAIPQPTIHRLLNNSNNDPRFSTLVTIANYFNLPLDYFLGKASANPEAVYTLKVYTLESFCERNELQSTEKTIITTAPHANCFGIKSTAHMTPKVAIGSVILIDPHRLGEDGDMIMVYFQNSKCYAIRLLHQDGPDKFISAINLNEQPKLLTTGVEIIGSAFQITTLL